MGVYGLFTLLRNYAFDKQWAWFKTKSFYKAKTICIGNLSVGGTGKTPMVIYLASYFLSKNLNVVIVSRGYKRKQKGNFFAEKDQDAFLIGDEPSQYIQEFSKEYGVNLFVYLCTRRDKGVEEILIEKPETDIILLDDGFQHRYIKAKKNILLTSFYRPFFKDKILPYGRLRESVKGRERANIIVITKTPEKTGEIQRQDFIERCLPLTNQTVFFSSISYGKVCNTKERIEQDTFWESCSRKIILVTGIASAKPLLDYINDNNIVVVRHFEYSDHHNFTEKEIEEIKFFYKTFTKKRESIPGLLTTQKDFLRLQVNRKTFEQLPWNYISIAPKILFNQELEFLKEIERN